MADTKSDKLFELVDWFNDFSDQLYSLFTRISNIDSEGKC